MRADDGRDGGLNRFMKKWTQEEIETVRKLRAQKKSWVEIGKVFGVKPDTARMAAKSPGSSPSSVPAPGPEIKVGYEFEDNGKDAVLRGVMRNIHTLDEAIAFAKVDLEVWEVDKWKFGKWEVTMREPATTVFNPDGTPMIATGDGGGKSTLWTRRNRKPMVEPMCKVEVTFKRKVVVQRTRALIEQMLTEFRKQAPHRPCVHKQTEGALLEVSIFDLHLGKLVWAPECGQDYDVKIAQSAFNESLETLIERTKGFKIGRILFPVGNDFFNVDGQEQETSAGTPQSEDGRWQKSFVQGRKLMLDAVYRLRELAPVDVVMVAGNHDMERVFYLGETLAGYLSKSDGVTVNNEPPLRKYYQWGKCLIGLTHGKEEKHKDLPLLMATERPEMWAASQFREFHLGHLHHKKETFYWNGVDEFKGFRVRVIPSLCPACAWHTMKGYMGLRAAEAFLWDKQGGMIGSFSCTP